MIALLPLVISTLSSFGISVALVERGDHWPLIQITDKLRELLRWAFPLTPAEEVLNCAVCLSFWTTFFTDILTSLYYRHLYFLWPLSGWITLGLTWTIYELLPPPKNADKNKEDSEKGL